MLEWAYEIQNLSTYTRIFVYWHCSICCYLSVDEIVEIFHQDFAEQLFIARDQDVISMLVQTVKWRRYIIYNISREICKAVVLLPFLWLFHDFSLVSYNRFIIVIAIGDDYRFAFFGLATKLWLKFQGLFLLVYGLLTLLFSCKTGLM